MRNAVKNLTRLPGIGRKTAERLVMHLLRASAREVNDLAASLMTLKKETRLCECCHTLSDKRFCRICDDPARDTGVICVVEGPAEMMAIENTGVFKGRYHVLHGVLSPMDGIGPDDIRVNDLLRRVEAGGFTEVVIATGTQVEGEATAAYLAERLSAYPVKTTRIASGMPIGGDLKYVDQVTLKNSLEKRYAL